MGILIDPYNSQIEALEDELEDVGVAHGQKAEISGPGAKVFDGILFFCEVSLVARNKIGEADGKPLPHGVVIPEGLELDDGHYFLDRVPVVLNGAIRLGLTENNFRRTGPLGPGEEPPIEEFLETGDTEPVVTL